MATRPRRKRPPHAPEPAIAPVRSAARDRWILVALVVVPLAVYGRVIGYDFINYDDPKHVLENPMVSSGLTAHGLVQAFTTGHAANWQPVTWLSHMIVCQLFGTKPGAHHATNLIIHLSNTVLWFLVLRLMTGAVWASAFAAALFALHPAHVESVAWVAERKDVLSTLFWLATLWWYVCWVRTRRPMAYGLSLVAYALGLMAKPPMLVTLPFTLLLLDWWPLERWSPFRPGGPRLRPVLEKLPFFALAAGASVVTFLVVRAGGAVDVSIPVDVRVENALVSYAAYLGMAIWPAGLAIYYPLATPLPAWKPIAAAIVLIVATALVLRTSRRYLVTGWLWYLGTLVPVIGLVQVGSQAMADRYTYVPFIGLFMLASWGMAEMARRWRIRPALVGTAGAMVLGVFAVISWLQVGYWRDSATLFRHALAVTADNSVAHASLGVALQEQGDLAGAAPHLEASYALNPDADAAYNLGNLRVAQQRLPEAVAAYEESLRLEPGRVKTLYNLANALRELGRTDDAIRRYREALRFDPEDADVRNNLGITLLRAGQLDDASAELEAALRRAPHDPVVHRNLGALHAQREEWALAVAEYESAHRELPDDAGLIEDLSFALASAGRAAEAGRLLEDAVVRLPGATRLVAALAWLRATSKDASARDGAEAVRLAERACRAERTPDCLDTLAAAYAEAGRFADALNTVRAAFEDADTSEGFRAELRERQALYEAGTPYRAP